MPSLNTCKTWAPHNQMIHSNTTNRRDQCATTALYHLFCLLLVAATPILASDAGQPKKAAWPVTFKDTGDDLADLLVVLQRLQAFRASGSEGAVREGERLRDGERLATRRGVSASRCGERPPRPGVTGPRSGGLRRSSNSAKGKRRPGPCAGVEAPDRKAI